MAAWTWLIPALSFGLLVLAALTGVGNVLAVLCGIGLMTFASSVVLLVVVLAAIGLVASVCFALKAPRRKREARRRHGPSAPLGDPPTITHYGHA